MSLSTLLTNEQKQFRVPIEASVHFFFIDGVEMLPVANPQSLACNVFPPFRPSISLPKRSIFPLRTLWKASSPSSLRLKSRDGCRVSLRSLRCSNVSVVSDPTHAELSSSNHRPSAAEVSRTIMELSNVGTLSTLTREGFPLGIGVRFAVDLNGAPVLCLNKFNTSLSADKKCSLHVQLEQCGARTPQCTIPGNIERPQDKMALRKMCAAWKKRFDEEVDENNIYFIDVERVLHIEDLSETGVWVSSLGYASAEPDPLRSCAEKIVEEINTHNAEDVRRFCNIYADLDIQVLEAKMVWVDRLGFDVHVRSVQNDVLEVRIPFPREIADEKGAKSSFNGMAQLAWEVEKNYHAPDFEKVTQSKKVLGTAF